MSANNSKILILYATVTGTTQDVATQLNERLTTQFPTLEVTVKNCNAAEPAELSGFNLIFFGASTWDDGLNPDAKYFLEKLGERKINLASLPFALFGLGSTYYEDFCKAIPLLKTALQSFGAEIVGPTFTIDNFPTPAVFSELEIWARDVIREIYK